MSTYWDVACLTCDKGLGLHGNHQEEGAILIAKDAEKLAMTGTMFPGLTIDPRHWGFYPETGAVETKWFIDHRGHNIKAKNEYGQVSGTCGEWLTCVTCGSQQKCPLPDKHDGDHNPLGKR